MQTFQYNRLPFYSAPLSPQSSPTHEPIRIENTSTDFRKQWLFVVWTQPQTSMCFIMPCYWESCAGVHGGHRTITHVSVEQTNGRVRVPRGQGEAVALRTVDRATDQHVLCHALLLAVLCGGHGGHRTLANVVVEQINGRVRVSSGQWKIRNSAERSRMLYLLFY
jgi:hypothetical protein